MLTLSLKQNQKGVYFHDSFLRYGSLSSIHYSKGDSKFSALLTYGRWWLRCMCHGLSCWADTRNPSSSVVVSLKLDQPGRCFATGSQNLLTRTICISFRSIALAPPPLANFN